MKHPPTILNNLYLQLNLIFILHVIIVLAIKVRANHDGSDTETLKKSVKAAFMLIPLLGIPNITQTIPFLPTKDNLAVCVLYLLLITQVIVIL
jgi:hypothetical protein